MKIAVCHRLTQGRRIPARGWLSNFLLFVLLLVLFYLFSGCAANMEKGGQTAISPSNTTAALLGNEALAYGRIKWIQNGEERTEYKHSFGWNIWPKYLRLNDMVDGSLNVNEDGTFTWLLPKGVYIVHQIHWFDSWDGLHRFTPKVAFLVPDYANTYCLGTLVIDLRTKRDIIGGLWVKGIKIRIDDECVAMVHEFRSRYSDPDLHHAKSLMIFDPDVPDRPHELEGRDKAQDFIRNIIPGVMTIY